MAGYFKSPATHAPPNAKYTRKDFQVLSPQYLDTEYRFGRSAVVDFRNRNEVETDVVQSQSNRCETLAGTRRKQCQLETMNPHEESAL